MKRLRILIVEDEILIAETIKLYLEERSHKVVDICISYDEAIAAYQQYKPDLVVLDIRLYGRKSGIDVALYLRNQSERTPFIYLTSQNDRRIAQLALETTPYGYLSKPIQKESLWTTVAAADRLHRERKSQAQAEQSVIVLQGRSQQYQVQEREVLYMQADHVYVMVYLTNGEKVTTRTSLAQVTEQAKGWRLFQTHRSYIVNLRHVHSWSKEGLMMRNGDEVPISRARRHELLAKLKK